MLSQNPLAHLDMPPDIQIENGELQLQSSPCYEGQQQGKCQQLHPAPLQQVAEFINRAHSDVVLDLRTLWEDNSEINSDAVTEITKAGDMPRRPQPQSAIT